MRGIFILPNIETLDGIVGLDLLNQVNTHINLRNVIIKHDFGKANFLFYSCGNVNFMNKKRKEIPYEIHYIYNMIKKENKFLTKFIIFTT